MRHDRSFDASRDRHQLSSVNPIKALYYSAVVNGLVAVPVIAMMMLITANEKVMGRFTIRGWLKILGWSTALLMAVAGVAMIVDLF